MTRKDISKAICSRLLRDGLVDESQETYLIMSVMDALKESKEENDLSKKIDTVCFYLYKDNLCTPSQEQYLKICLAEAYKEAVVQEDELVSPNPYQSISLQGNFLKEHFDKDNLTDYEKQKNNKGDKRMNRESLKRKLRSIELAYDFNYQAHSYDITVNLEKLADLIEDIVKHPEKSFSENCKTEPVTPIPLQSDFTNDDLEY